MKIYAKTRKEMLYRSSWGSYGMKNMTAKLTTLKK